MASRHRHRRRSSLIEIAEIEEGKAEAEETKRGARRRWARCQTQGDVFATAICFIESLDAGVEAFAFG
jgi:hypothetical protein